MIGVNLHKIPENRQEMAQFFGSYNQGLVFWYTKRHTHTAGGNIFPVASAIVRHDNPYYLERVAPPICNPFDFSHKFNVLSHRRRVAEFRTFDRALLNTRPNPGFVRPAVKRKKQGILGCERRNYWRHWPYAAVLRPAARQRENKRLLAVPQGSGPRSCSTETRSSGLRPELQPTCFIVSKTQENVTNPASHDTELTKLNTLVTGADVTSATGALRCQTPNSKDT
jgi:hypothetical protein